ncbi:hypothetical protein ACFX13_045367 [Malus domestica]
MFLVKINDPSYLEFMWSTFKDCPTVIYEDNVTYVAQMKERFIKGDKTKHIFPKFFSAYELQNVEVIEIRQIHSNENLADLFTKSLSKCTF